jgi:TonB family protein
MTHRWLAVASLACHLAMALGLALANVCQLERLAPAHRPDVTFDVPLEPPRADDQAHELRQPPPWRSRCDLAPCVHRPPGGYPRWEPPRPPVCGNGVVELGEQCDDGNTIDGDGCAAACEREAPRSAATPLLVPTTTLLALRIAGGPQVEPDAATQRRIHDGRIRATSIVKVCIGVDGDVTSAETLKASGYPAYDGAVKRAVHAWRHRPYTVAGRAVPACSAVTFIYAIRP